MKTSKTAALLAAALLISGGVFTSYADEPGGINVNGYPHDPVTGGTYPSVGVDNGGSLEMTGVTVN